MRLGSCYRKEKNKAMADSPDKRERDTQKLRITTETLRNILRQKPESKRHREKHRETGKERHTDGSWKPEDTC